MNDTTDDPIVTAEDALAWLLYLFIAGVFGIAFAVWAYFSVWPVAVAVF